MTSSAAPTPMMPKAASAVAVGAPDSPGGSPNDSPSARSAPWIAQPLSRCRRTSVAIVVRVKSATSPVATLWIKR